MEMINTQQVVATMNQPVSALEELARTQFVGTGELIAQARDIKVTNAETFQAAGEWSTRLASQKKAVQDFFKDAKAAAYAAHKAITKQEKTLLDPIDAAITNLRQEMGAYQLEQERKAQAEAERLRKEKEAAAQAALDLAVEMEKAGDLAAAQEALEDAETIQSTSMVVEPVMEKVSGVSFKTDWAIEVTDEEKVPVSLMGMVIRPVDLSAVKALVKASKGKIQIPGIKITETRTSVIRSR